MSQTFAVMDENPNMGHGCLCSEIGTQESHGPFVVFSATEMDTTESPFPVLCANCAVRAAQLIPQPDGPKSAPSPRRKDRGTTQLEDGPSI